LEKLNPVDQKIERKFHVVCRFILDHRDVFRRQGSVVPCWRTYRGHRLGPFFSLRYRVEGRQTAIYLGRSAILAERVRGLLRDLQQDVQKGRTFARLTRQAQMQLRRSKNRWHRELAAMGLYLKGFEIRGWSALPQVETTAAPTRLGETSS
jgi:hypothetical protein